MRIRAAHLTDCETLAKEHVYGTIPEFVFAGITSTAEVKVSVERGILTCPGRDMRYESRGDSPVNASANSR